MSRIDEQMVNSIRVLSMDMIEKANSGHPGLPMGAAPMAFSLWKNHLKFNPEHPTWFNRDRFVLSAGHGSAMLYSLLHLFGYDLPMSELKTSAKLVVKRPVILNSVIRLVSMQLPVHLVKVSQWELGWRWPRLTLAPNLTNLNSRLLTIIPTCYAETAV